MKITLLMPVFNEELRLERGIRELMIFLKEKSPDQYEVIIVDNGSEDGTEEIAGRLLLDYKNLRYIRITKRGVGAAFRAGVEECKTDIVGYMDIDLSTRLEFLDVMEKCFFYEHAEIVNASRYARDSAVIGRRWYRNIISYGCVVFLKAVLKMKATDAICGFKFFKRDVAKQLIEESGEENGWFFMIELLIRAEREGKRIVEIPVIWDYDAVHSKVRIWKVAKEYVYGAFNLKKRLKG